MAIELRIAPEVEEDLCSAYDWYEERRKGLGEEFLSCVDATIQSMCRFPQAHRKVQGEYRRALVRRFPFAVFYECEAGILTVYCVFHTSRDPRKWKRRLD